MFIYDLSICILTSLMNRSEAIMATESVATVSNDPSFGFDCNVELANGPLNLANAYELCSIGAGKMEPA